MKNKIGYSIIASDLVNIIPIIQKVNFVDFLHIDIMDGNFVPSLTIGPSYVSNLIDNLKNNNIDKFIDVHLMVNDPEKYIDKLTNVDRIIFHIENNNTQNLINKIKNYNIHVGISISPNTNIDVLYPYVENIDLVQIMTVEPGKCGQKIIPECIQKINILRQKYPNLDIQIDGGVNSNNLKELVDEGANSFISGSAILKETDAIKLFFRQTS